jgi:tRNA (guanine10-N2)-dimethyltransferase
VRLLVELSGEHDELPLAELRATLVIVGGRVLDVDGLVATVDAEPGAYAFLARRLALAHAICEAWWSGPAGRVAEAARPVEGTVAVRARRLEGAQPGASTAAAARDLGAALGAPVDLDAPDNDVRVLLSKRAAHVGRLVAQVDRRAFDARAVRHRAHFAPVSLHPRYARALVNLAGVREGDRVADPFVGTGGLALEAGLVGARVVGSDLDPRMAAGARATLHEHGVAGAVVETRDVGELPELAGGEASLDAVVSDPPYGRSSTTNREPLDELYERFYAAAEDALRPGGRLAIIVPTDELRRRAAKRFRLVSSFDQKVHRSMTRHYGVLEK